MNTNKLLKKSIKEGEIKVVKVTCSLMIEVAKDRLEGVTRELEFYVAQDQKIHGIIAEIIK